MLSVIPPVLPILKHPDLIPPTVAGPITATPFSSALLMRILVQFSGMPSAMMAMQRICGLNHLFKSNSYKVQVKQ